MGFFSDLFGTSKPKVSKNEFKEACSLLSAQGFSDREINEVKKIFRPDIEESLESERGIDRVEITNAIKWLKEHSSSHCIPPSKIAILEQILTKKL